jgi:hypothetical protein
MPTLRILSRTSARLLASAFLGAAAVATLGGIASPAAQAGDQVPRMSDGRPDLNGTWQAINTANWDIQDHPARQGPVLALGGSFAVPPGQGVVDGNTIPYQPWALAKKQENADNWLTLDPEIKCYLPGVPRATYQGYPFQIVQSPTDMILAYEFANASRVIYMNSKTESPSQFWMGWSRGRWEGDTLVIDVTGFTDKTWFDRAGNFHSDELHVVERYTPMGRNHIAYEATIEDPKVFTRPWTMRMPLYRRMEPRIRPLEFICVEFVEELLYGKLRRR